MRSRDPSISSTASLFWKDIFHFQPTFPPPPLPGSIPLLQPFALSYSGQWGAPDPPCSPAPCALSPGARGLLLRDSPRGHGALNSGTVLHPASRLCFEQVGAPLGRSCCPGCALIPPGFDAAAWPFTGRGVWTRSPGGTGRWPAACGKGCPATTDYCLSKPPPAPVSPRIRSACCFLSSLCPLAGPRV